MSNKVLILPRQAKTAVPNWFGYPSFAVFNSSVMFSTFVERRLNQAWVSVNPARENQQTVPSSGSLKSESSGRKSKARDKRATVRLTLFWLFPYVGTYLWKKIDQTIYPTETCVFRKRVLYIIILFLRQNAPSKCSIFRIKMFGHPKESWQLADNA